MKLFHSISIAVLLITTCSFSLTAQSFPIPSTIRTPHGNVTTYSYHRMPIYYGSSGITSNKYDFHVVFKNDSVAKVTARINVFDSIHSITYKRKGQKHIILPPDTKELYRILSTGKKVTGFPTDSCWLFLVDKGKINSYSFVSEIGLDHVAAIQHGDNAKIVPLTQDNLMHMVGENEKLIKLIKKKRFSRTILMYNNQNTDGKKMPAVNEGHRK